MELIKIDQNKCTQCFACIRACPVKAIQVNDKNSVFVEHDRCIACGNCYVNCSIGAISYTQSIKPVEKLLNSDNEVVCIVDPAIAAEFPDITDYRNFVGMIRAVGFKKVCEISFGADLVAKEYGELIKNFKGKYYISSACPPVVEYIEKFQPGIIDSLIPTCSPLIATAKAAKKKYGENIKLVAISPCIAQKKEITRYPGIIDEVISFVELRQMFAARNINENSVEFSEFDPPHGKKGSLYPLSQGILEAAGINTKSFEHKIISRDGSYEFRQNIDDFADIPSVKHHLNIFFCKGCSMGPCTSSNQSFLQAYSLVVNFAEKRIGKVSDKKHKQEMEYFSNMQLMPVISPNDRRLPNPPEEKVKQVLKLLGHETYENHSCQSCGYKSCREFAVDVAKNLMKPEMCVTYTLRNRQDYIKQLTETNRILADTKKALEVSERKMRAERESANETMSLIDSVMQKLPSGVVIVDKKLSIMKSNERFINLLGADAAEIADIIPGLVGADLHNLLPKDIYTLFEYVINENIPVENKDVNYKDNLFNLSVFPIQKASIVAAVFRDMHEPEVRSDEVVNRVNEVIEKNLNMVQQIGFLLGEGASETEKMLNSIIESFRKDKQS